MQTSQAACVLFHHDKVLHSHSLSKDAEDAGIGYSQLPDEETGWGESRVTC